MHGIESGHPYFEGKDVIMWRSDRGDTEELYRSFLPGIKNFTTIDEIDFSGNIHGMKYHFIQTLKNPLAEMVGNEKTIDFLKFSQNALKDKYFQHNEE